MALLFRVLLVFFNFVANLCFKLYIRMLKRRSRPYLP